MDTLIEINFVDAEWIFTFLYHLSKIYHFDWVLSIITLSHLFRIWKKYLKDTKKYFFTIETQRLKIHVQNIRKKKKKQQLFQDPQ